MNNVGLVFAGGGVKGSYQIGVWRALNELNFDIRSVVGTSIGSVNGALFAMGAYDLAQELWSKISINNIVNINSQSDNLFDIKNMINLFGEFYKNNGLDVTPLKNLLNEIIDEKKVRNSVIDFGLVTYSLTDFKGMSLFKNDIPDGKLVDYILASACLPGFKSQKIDDKKFIDGAVNNNMPIDMLIDKGIKNIIAVDVGGIGVYKNVNTSGINIFTVKCSENVLGTMDFNSENIKKSMKLGYYDCYKTFGRLMGAKYYFNTNDYCMAKAEYSQEILEGIEHAAEIFNIDNIAVYKVDKLIRGVIKGYRHAKLRYKRMQKDNLLEFIGEIPQLDDGVIIAWIVEQLLNDKLNFLSNKIIMNLRANVFSAASSITYLLS